MMFLLGIQKRLWNNHSRIVLFCRYIFPRHLTILSIKLNCTRNFSKMYLLPFPLTLAPSITGVFFKAKIYLSTALQQKTNSLGEGQNP